MLRPVRDFFASPSLVAKKEPVQDGGEGTGLQRARLLASGEGVCSPEQPLEGVYD